MGIHPGTKGGAEIGGSVGKVTEATVGKVIGFGVDDVQGGRVLDGVGDPDGEHEGGETGGG